MERSCGAWFRGPLRETGGNFLFARLVRACWKSGLRAKTLSGSFVDVGLFDKDD